MMKKDILPVSALREIHKGTEEAIEGPAAVDPEVVPTIVVEVVTVIDAMIEEAGTKIVTDEKTEAEAVVRIAEEIKGLLAPNHVPDRGHAPGIKGHALTPPRIAMLNPVAMTVAEIEALEAYVHGGGGLLLAWRRSG